MLDKDKTEALADPSLLLFGDLSILDLSAVFTDSDAHELALAAGLNARTVPELANAVTREKRRLGLGK